MKKILLLVLLIIVLGFYSSTKAQVLAYEGFDYFNNASVSLHQINQGKFSGATVSNWDKSLGWAGDWRENPVGTTFQVSSSPSTVYTGTNGYDLITAGKYAVAGGNSTSIGRKLQNSPAGPFSLNGSTENYLVSSAATYNADNYNSTQMSIGRDGTTLWISFLINKQVNNNNLAYLSMHSNDATLADGNTGNNIAIGYFGASSNVTVAGVATRYWSVRVNGTITRSTAVVGAGAWTLLVARINFNSTSGNTVTLYVNPTNIGVNATPTTVFPAVTTPATAAGVVNRFRNIAYYGGGNGESFIDEIRFARDYKSVTNASNLIRVEGSVCGGALGNNIFTNGDFDSYSTTPTYNTATVNDPWRASAGNPAVRSIDNVGPWTDVTGGSYCYIRDLNTLTGNWGPQDGYYTIVNGVRNAFGIWVTNNDFSGNGYMMLVNAAFQPGVFFRQVPSNSFCEQTTYEFSVQVLNIDQPNLPTAYNPTAVTANSYRTCDPVREPGCEQISQRGTAGSASPATSATTCNAFTWYPSGTTNTTSNGRMFRVLPDI